MKILAIFIPNILAKKQPIKEDLVLKKPLLLHHHTRLSEYQVMPPPTGGGVKITRTGFFRRVGGVSGWENLERGVIYILLFEIH